MAIVEMQRVKTTYPEQAMGSIYATKLDSFSDSQSDTYLLPVNEIYSISLFLNGDGEIYVTNDPDGLTGFVAWDGLSQVQNGITAFYVSVNSGSVDAQIVVKTTSQ